MHFVCGEYERGGMQKHVLELAASQRAAGDATAIAAQETFRARVPSGVEFLPIDTMRNRRDRALHEDLRELLAVWKPDVLHAHAGKASEITAALMPLACAAVSTVHGIKRNLRAPARLDHVIAVSEFAARRLPAEKTTVVLNGVSIRAGAEPSAGTLRDFFGRAGDQPIAIAVGRLAPVKGFDTAIRAWRRIERGRLLIVGDGPERGRLERMVEKHGLRGRIAFAGERADAADLIGQGALLVAPSQREGFSYVVIEALLRRVPVVTTTTSGASPMLPEAFLVPPGRPRQLASAVQRALEAPETTLQAFAPAFQRAALELTIQGMTRGTRSVYEAAMAASASRRSGVSL
jgi:glycosyltransferase involved in cell wall biosynthesis